METEDLAICTSVVESFNSARPAHLPAARIEQTGGGCVAAAIRFEDGAYILITAEEQEFDPAEDGSDPTNVILGRYVVEDAEDADNFFELPAAEAVTKALAWVAGYGLEWGLRALKSVGSIIDLSELMVYPAFRDWTPDLENGTPLDDGTDEWWDALDPQDARTVEAAKRQERR